MKKGFTLIEVLLVISILGILAGLSIPFLINFKNSQDFDNTVDQMISVLRKAQEKSISAEKDSFWGVNFSQPFRYILFRENFNQNNPENEIYEFSKNINLTTSGQEIKFLKLSGGIEEDFIIDLTTFNKKIRIIINREGKIDYFKL
jgi:prepilin-type N-terminal cleavage/methylation domain-containing protein